MPRIAGAGICCLDRIVISPGVEWGDTAIVEEYIEQGGGLVATALVACARLGAECDFYSLLGDDQIGRQITDELVSEGVNCAGISVAEGGGSPFSFIHVAKETGERTIFHRPGNGLAITETDMSAISESDALIVDDIYMGLSISAAQYARSHRIPVVADAVPGPCNSALFEHVDVLIAPRHFARQIGCEGNLDAALDAIHRLGPTTAVITLGSDGWVYSDASGKGGGNAFKVDVVDTTGAGDVFHGAFAYALACGWETPRCAEFASAVSALKCTKPGGRTGIPDLETTMRFLEERQGISPPTSEGEG